MRLGRPPRSTTLLLAAAAAVMSASGVLVSTEVVHPAAAAIAVVIPCVVAAVCLLASTSTPPRSTRPSPTSGTRAATGRAPPPTATNGERAVVVTVAVATAVGAVAAGPHPTANRVSDAFFVAALAALVVASVSIARTWAWIAASGAAAVFADGAWTFVALAALVVAIAAVFVDLPYRRAVGAAIGGAALQALLRLHVEPFGASALVTAGAAAVLVASAYPLAHKPTRRLARLAGLGVAGAALVLAAGFTLVSLHTRHTLELAVDRASEGLAAARSGDTARAAALLQQASESFREANGDLRSWLGRPAVVLPVLGQQARSLDLLSRPARTSPPRPPAPPGRRTSRPSRSAGAGSTWRVSPPWPRPSTRSPTRWSPPSVQPRRPTPPGCCAPSTGGSPASRTRWATRSPTPPSRPTPSPWSRACSAAKGNGITSSRSRRRRRRATSAGSPGRSGS